MKVNELHELLTLMYYEGVTENDTVQMLHLTIKEKERKKSHKTRYYRTEKTATQISRGPWVSERATFPFCRKK